MGILVLLTGALAFMAILALSLLLKLTFSWWVSPIQTYRKLKRCGFGGPPPSFPLGNIEEMKKKNIFNSSLMSSKFTHDIHPTALPYFSRWQNSHGKLSNELCYLSITLQYQIQYLFYINIYNTFFF